MHLIPIALRRPDTGDEAPSRPQAVVDILWAAVLPAYRIEHIAVVADGAYLRIGLYGLASDAAAAHRDAADLIRRAMAMSPLLRRWAEVDGH
jgi:hypothetical protein